MTRDHNWACNGWRELIFWKIIDRFQKLTWNFAFVILTTTLRLLLHEITFIICRHTKDIILASFSLPSAILCATKETNRRPPSFLYWKGWLTFKLLLLTDGSTRRLGGCFLWIRFRKSTLTTCCEMVSWKRSNTWHRLLRVRFFWFSWRQSRDTTLVNF